MFSHDYAIVILAFFTEKPVFHVSFFKHLQKGGIFLDSALLKM